jgi:hypothetical protein
MFAYGPAAVELEKLPKRWEGFADGRYERVARTRKADSDRRGRLAGGLLLSGVAVNRVHRDYTIVALELLSEAEARACSRQAAIKEHARRSIPSSSSSRC